MQGFFIDFQTKNKLREELLKNMKITFEVKKVIVYLISEIEKNSKKKN